MKHLIAFLAVIALALPGSIALAGAGHDEAPPVVVESDDDHHDTHVDDEPKVELDENGNPMHGEIGHNHEIHHGQLDE